MQEGGRQQHTLVIKPCRRMRRHRRRHQYHQRQQQHRHTRGGGAVGEQQGGEHKTRANLHQARFRRRGTQGVQQRQINRCHQHRGLQRHRRGLTHHQRERRPGCHPRGGDRHLRADLGRHRQCQNEQEQRAANRHRLGHDGAAMHDDGEIAEQIDEKIDVHLSAPPP